MAQARKAAKQGQRYRFQYAVKFLCLANIPGTSSTSDSVLPGVYQTAVNIHNPNNQRVLLRKKIAVPGLEPSNFINETLKPDSSSNVNCREITNEYGVTFIHGAEGFLVIESTLTLDVVAIYTAGKRGSEVESIDVEQIRERRIGGR